MEDMEKRIREMFQREKDKKLENYRQLNRYAVKGGTLFTGSSLMELFPVCEYCMDAGIRGPVYNRGIGGYVTDEFLKALDVMLLDLEPSRVFINIGTNDISAQPGGEPWQVHLEKNYRAILSALKEKLPEATVYMMAYYPVNPDTPGGKQNPGLVVRTNAALEEANRMVALLAREFGYHYIDVNDGLKDEQGRLLAEHTQDGMHFDAEAYRSVFERLLPYLA